MAAHEVVVAAEVDLVEVRLRHPIRGDLDLSQNPGRPLHLLEVVDTAHDLDLTHVADPEAHHLQGGEGVDDTTMIMTEDVAPVAIAMTVTPDAEAAGVVRGIEGATVEEIFGTYSCHIRAPETTRERGRRSETCAGHLA